jgi:PKD repeat protein
VPLTVQFDGRASSDPDGQPLTYAWDLDADGDFDDSSSATPSWTYNSAGTFTARLRVTDPALLTDVVNVPIRAGNPPVPQITIDSPAAGVRWRVNDTIAFSGSAVEADGDPIPASGLTWDINLHHCDRDSGSCHVHQLQSFPGVASGSFPAPDHAYPSYLEIELTARDSAGLTGIATRRLDPRTVKLTLNSRPPGVRIAHSGETSAAPFTREVIHGSTNSLAVESPQTLLGVPHLFTSWSNGGARVHSTLVAADTTLTVDFVPSTARRMAGADWVGPEYPASVAPPGVAEVYRMIADHSGSATELRLFVAHSSTATALVMGLYADAGGEPGALLGSGRVALPAPGTWNKVDVDIPGIVAGRAYWIGILNPSDGTGSLRWRDRADDSLSPERQTVAPPPLAELPGTWGTEGDKEWDGGPVSAYVWGPPPPAPPSSPPPPPAPPPAETPVEPAAPDSGPVGAWGFDESRGRAALDASGTGNRGRLSGPVRTRGRFGGGLSFDGRNDWVTIPDSRSLDLRSAMTLEAWVRPARGGARSVLLKERGTRLAYGLYARPSAHVFTTAERALRGRPGLRRNRWAHLAMTWNGRTLRVYVDGSQVAAHALGGRARTSSGPLRIGGNAIWPEFFKGVIDEVRVYDRALAAGEIARDRVTPVNPGAARPRPRTSSGGRLRATRREAHRGTRWLSGARGAALRAG